MGRPIDDNYSRNQCALLIRMDGDELYMPLNFSMRADEIRDIYPYLLDMFNNPIPNPSLQFQRDDAKGKYKNLSEKERRELILNVKRLSLLWYNKAEESLLSIALRFAVDIKLRGIEELRHLFETVRPVEKLDVDRQLTDEEAEQFLVQTGLVTDTDREFDPGSEQDVALGVAGDLSVNMYGSGAPEDYLNEELDMLESKLKVKDEFQQVADGQASADTYTKYEKGRKLTAAQMQGGLLLYDENEGSVLDALDREDGLTSPQYDDDYEDFRNESGSNNGQQDSVPDDGFEDDGDYGDGLGNDVMPDEGDPDYEDNPEEYEDEPEGGSADFLAFGEEDPDVDYYGDDEAPDSGDEE